MSLLVISRFIALRCGLHNVRSDCAYDTVWIFQLVCYNRRRRDGGMRMARSKFSIARKDEAMQELMSTTDHKTLARWAIDCAERVMPYFEQTYPQDRRPRQAIET